MAARLVVVARRSEKKIIFFDIQIEGGAKYEFFSKFHNRSFTVLQLN